MRFQNVSVPRFSSIWFSDRLGRIRVNYVLVDGVAESIFVLHIFFLTSGSVHTPLNRYSTYSFAFSPLNVKYYTCFLAL